MSVVGAADDETPLSGGRWTAGVVRVGETVRRRPSTFVAGRPVAWIDFDFAAPGDPIEDVAYVAWSWCISGRADRGPALVQARQVRLVADAYGLHRRDCVRLLAAIHEQLNRNIAVWQAVAAG